MDRERYWIREIQKRRSPEAGNQLIKKYYREIYGYVYKQCFNRELAMDLTQEIFLSLLKSIEDYDASRSSFRTWLYRIATNRIVDYYRSRYYRYTQIKEPLEEAQLQSGEDFTLQIETK